MAATATMPDIMPVAIEAVHAINEAHRRIYALQPNGKLSDVVDDICRGPYALECAYALASATTADTWFRGAYGHKIWPLMRWLIFMYGTVNARCRNLAIDAMHARGYEHICRWVINMPWYEAADAGYLVQNMAHKGMFQLVKYIFERYDWCFRRQNGQVLNKRHVFACACMHHCMWFIRWLDKTYGVTLDDVCGNTMDAFGAACEYGHWPLARWMAIRFNLTRTHIRRARDQPLIRACASGQLNVARWLTEHFRLTVQDARIDSGRAFIYACAYGHLDVAQWLADWFRLTTRDARACHNSALICAIYEGHTAIARWLAGRFGLGREGTRVSGYHMLSTCTTSVPVDALKWYLTAFEPRWRHKDSLYCILINAAGGKSHVEFAWWVARRFGIIPDDINDTFGTFKHNTPRRAAHAQQWLDAFTAE